MILGVYLEYFCHFSEQIIASKRMNNAQEAIKLIADLINSHIQFQLSADFPRLHDVHARHVFFTSGAVAHPPEALLKRGHLPDVQGV